MENKKNEYGFEEKKVKVGKIWINYVEKGRGKTIVLIHGWNNNWIGFVPVAKFLVKKYRVIIPDLPGYGDSGRLKKYNCKIEAFYLKKFVDKLKIKRPMLAGHSMGTLVLGMFCKRYPIRAGKIILIGSVFRKKNDSTKTKLWTNFFEFVSKRERVESGVKKMVDKKSYSYLTAKYINMYKFNKKIIDEFGTKGKEKMDKKAYSQMGVEIGRIKEGDLIAKNKIPILLIFGKYDKICNCKTAKEVLAGRGKYEFWEIDKAGHVVTVEKPQKVAEVIERFVE